MMKRIIMLSLGLSVVLVSVAYFVINFDISVRRSLIDISENTKLLLLIKNGSLEEIAAAIDEYPGSVNEEYPNELRPIDVALTIKRHDVMLLLIQRGANINHKVQSGEFEGFTPLYNAIASGDISSVKILVKSGAQLNHEFQDKTPAQYAKYLGQENIAKYLSNCNNQPTSQP